MNVVYVDDLLQCEVSEKETKRQPMETGKRSGGFTLLWRVGTHPDLELTTIPGS